MSVAKAKEALTAMRYHVDQKNLDEAAKWALVYLVEDRATQVGFEMRERYESQPLDS